MIVFFIFKSMNVKLVKLNTSSLEYYFCNWVKKRMHLLLPFNFSSIHVSIRSTMPRRVWANRHGQLRDDLEFAHTTANHIEILLASVRSA